MKIFTDILNSLWYLLFQLSDLHKQTIHPSITGGEGSCDPIDPLGAEQQGVKSSTAHSSRPNVSSAETSSFAYMEDEFFNNPTILQLPRRLQVWFFLARTRIVQRLIMVSDYILNQCGINVHSFIEALLHCFLQCWQFYAEISLLLCCVCLGCNWSWSSTVSFLLEISAILHPL